MTKYARKCGDNTACGGEAIIPLEEEAREWVEQYCDAETYIAAFGVPPEA